jgi:hypothetical protein
MAGAVEPQLDVRIADRHAQHTGSFREMGAEQSIGNDGVTRVGHRGDSSVGEVA